MPIYENAELVRLLARMELGDQIPEALYLTIAEIIAFAWQLRGKVPPGFEDTPTGRVWYPYTEDQVQSLIVLLKDISKRNGIDPRNIIGHSDIAPLRKLDPGPLFPWKRLADEGLSVWPDAQAVARFQVQYAAELPSITWFQEELALLGYPTPQTGELDVATRHVIAAFQMRFRPSRFDGVPDAESAAILRALNRR